MNYYMTGALSGGLVIIFGAFGAHALKEVLNEQSLLIYEKAALYQMFHTVAILILGVIEKVQPQLHLHWVGCLFLIGMIIFSGSLYLLAVTGVKWLGAITPFGGISLILGWLLFIWISIHNNN